MTLVLAILGLGALIVVHEMGHMFVARMFGMRVERFSVGFGPVLARWHGKKTTYQLALIPLGGFVQIAGMNPHDQLPPDDAGSYENKPPSARFATIFAGPLTNYVFAILIMAVVMIAWGFPQWQHAVSEVSSGSPAAAAGLEPGDAIEKVNGEPVPAVTDVIAAIEASKGKPITLTALRGEQRVKLQVTPRAEDGTFRIGIGFGRKLWFSELTAGRALALALYFPVEQTTRALSGLGQLFSGKASVKQVGGPVEIVRQLKLSFEDSLAMAILFLAILSVYLGLFNLLPIPALDGGRLIFLLYAMITRRPVSQKVENAVHTVGFLLLLLLIILVSFGDVMRMFGAR